MSPLIKRLRSQAWRLGGSLLILALLAAQAIGLLALPGMGLLESRIDDWRVQALAEGTVDDRVVIVDIDEKSLAPAGQGGEGRWPWPRNRLAALLERLFKDYGVELVAFDIMLPERDESSGLSVLESLAARELRGVPAFAQALEKLRPALSYDRLMGQAMTLGPVVLGYAFQNDASAAGTVLPEGLDAGQAGLEQLKALSYPGATGLLPELAEHAAGSGHLNPRRDADGITRRVPMLVEHQGRYYPALSLAVLQQVVGGEPLAFVTADYGSAGRKVEALSIGPLALPVDESLNAVVPYRGGSRSFPYLSAADVLQGRVAKEALQDRFVLIGTSAAGLSDLVTTPLSASFPGVEVHANLITGVLDGRVPRAPAYAGGAGLLSVLLAGLLVILAGLRRKPWLILLAAVAAAVALTALNLQMLRSHQLLLPLAAPLACVLALFVWQMSVGYFIESRGKRQMSQLFAYYVPPELVDRMAADPGAFSMVPVERVLTVLFADVRGFTTISEQLSPGDLANYINAYLTAMSRVIREGHRGTLDKYIGDAVMAFWGAPLPNEQHAADGVNAALGMMEEARRLNDEFTLRGWPPLKIGIGLNSGPMRVGDMGSQIRRAYTVMGDAVNLGSRLEGLTKAYGVGVLIGESTHALLRDCVCREIDRVRVKGKDTPVAIFEPLGPASTVDQAVHDELARWNEALGAYRQQRWEDAQALLLPLQAAHPDRLLYRLYLERVAHYRAQPPGAHWDGATNFDTK